MNEAHSHNSVADLCEQCCCGPHLAVFVLVAAQHPQTTVRTVEFHCRPGIYFRGFQTSKYKIFEVIAPNEPDESV